MAHNWRYKEGGVNPQNGQTISFAAGYRWVNSDIGDDGNPGTESLPYATPELNKFNICAGDFFNVAVQANYIADGYCSFHWNLLTDSSMGVSGSYAYGIKTAKGLGFDARGSLVNCICNNPNSQSGISNPTGRYFSIFIYHSALTIQYNHGGISESIPSNYTNIFKAAITYDNWRSRPASNMVYANGGSGTVNIQDINVCKNTRYCLYISDLPIKLTGGGLGSDETTFTAPTDIDSLRNRAVAVYGGQAADYFPNCRVLPPTIFNDDYSLNTTAEGLIAATMSDNFSFVGAKDIALQWKPGTVDYVSTTNLTLDSGEYKLTDTNLDGNAISVIKTFGKVRELKRQFFEGVEAPLNGQVIDSTQSWGPEISPDTGNDYTGLIVDDYYTVFSGGGVTYNGTLYSVGQTFKVVTGVTTATDDDGTGSLRKQLEAPNKKNMRWRFSKGGALTSNIAADRVDEDWMYVLSGSINDGTTTYNVGDVFKYDTGLTYSGTYQLQFIFNDSEPWKEMEISGANNLSVDSAGRGNGDPDFDYASEEGVQTKYAQHQVVIESDNNRFLLS